MIAGWDMIEERQHQGYELSPGTVSPILHHLQSRQNYKITSKGRKLLGEAREKLNELFREAADNSHIKSD
jgi:DNA-binding PadR family transcriptional regulator